MPGEKTAQPFTEAPLRHCIRACIAHNENKRHAEEHTHSPMRSNHALTVEVIFGIHCRLNKSAERCKGELDLKPRILDESGYRKLSCSGGKVAWLMSAGTAMPQEAVS